MERAPEEVDLCRQAQNTKGFLGMDSNPGYAHVNGFWEIFRRGQEFFLKTPSGRSYRIPDVPLYKWWALSSCCRGQTWKYGDQESKNFIDREGFENFSSPPGIRFPPKGLYQILAFKRILLSNTCLWLDMGLGKTFITLLACMEFFRRNQSRFLIVCPVSVFFSWEEEIRKHLVPEISPNIEILHGPKRKPKIARLSLYPKADQEKPNFFITSYESLAASVEGLRTAGLSMIVFDECSKIKNMDTARTKAAHLLVKDFPGRVLCLSGTPSTKSPEGFFSFYELMGKGGSGQSSFFNFRKEYLCATRLLKVMLPNGKIKFCKEENYKFLIKRFGSGGRILAKFQKFTFNGLKLEDLKRLTRRHAYVLKKEEVAKDLPPKIFMKRKIQMSAEQKEAYEQILEGGKGQSEKLEFSHHFFLHSVTGKLHQIANGFFIYPDKSIKFFNRQPKFEEIEHVLNEIGNRKTILWTPFRFQNQKLMGFLKSKEISAVQLYGDNSAAERKESLENFRDSSGQTVLVANPEVAGFGLNLEFSHNQIFVTNWFKPDVRKQAVDRQHRITQTSPVTVIDLVTADTVEERILDSLREEIKVEELIFSF